MPRQRGTAGVGSTKQRFKRGPLPKAVKSGGQGDTYRYDRASAFGTIHGVNKGGKNSLTGGKS